MKDKTKNIIIGGLIIIIIIALIVIYFLITNKSNAINEVTGTIIVADSKYVIMESNNSDYLVSNIKGEYHIGDVVKFTYREKDLDINEEPKKITIIDEELVEAKIVEKESDYNSNKDNESNSSKVENNTNSTSKGSNNTSNNKNNNINSTNKNNISNNNSNVSNNSNNSTVKPNTNTNSNNSSNSVRNADTEVLSYFDDLKKDFSASSIKASVKSGFITVVDFLFYHGKIKGYTFSELSDSAKLKVLSLALYFDSKIEKYFPGYKESISNTTGKVYMNVKEEIVKTYLELTTAICSKNNELCIKAKEGFNDLKNTFSLSWALIKDIAGDGLSNLKNWYEIWSGK